MLVIGSKIGNKKTLSQITGFSTEIEIVVTKIQDLWSRKSVQEIDWQKRVKVGKTETRRVQPKNVVLGKRFFKIRRIIFRAGFQTDQGIWIVLQHYDCCFLENEGNHSQFFFQTLKPVLRRKRRSWFSWQRDKLREISRKFTRSISKITGSPSLRRE